MSAACSITLLTVTSSDVQGKFKHATGSVMAQANARNYALGLEGVSYEGPLRVRLPVKKKLDTDGSFSFEIPLPNPDRQVLLKRFAGGFKQALISPLSVQQVATQIASQTLSSQPSATSGQAVTPCPSLLHCACSALDGDYHLLQCFLTFKQGSMVAALQHSKQQNNSSADCFQDCGMANRRLSLLMQR